MTLQCLQCATSILGAQVFTSYHLCRKQGLGAKAPKMHLRKSAHPCRMLLTSLLHPGIYPSCFSLNDFAFCWTPRAFTSGHLTWLSCNRFSVTLINYHVVQTWRNSDFWSSSSVPGPLHVVAILILIITRWCRYWCFTGKQQRCREVKWLFKVPQLVSSRTGICTQVCLLHVVLILGP